MKIRTYESSAGDFRVEIDARSTLHHYDSHYFTDDGWSICALRENLAETLVNAVRFKNANSGVAAGRLATLLFKVLLPEERAELCRLLSANETTEEKPQ